MNRSERNQRAMEVAKRFATKRFVGHPDREELIADSVSLAWQGGQTAADEVTPANIAWFAVRKAASGDLRFEGSSRSITHSHRRGRIEFREIFDQFSNGLRDDPAEIVQAKLDYLGWLKSLPPHKRWLVILMQAGWTTGALARRFQKSPGRISQIRLELLENWIEFTNG